MDTNKNQNQINKPISKLRLHLRRLSWRLHFFVHYRVLRSHHRLSPKTARRLVAGFGLVFIVFIGLYNVTFLKPHKIDYSFSNKACYSSPLLLPDLHNIRSSESYTVNQKDDLVIAGFSIYSSGACVLPTSSVAENTSQKVVISSKILPFAAKEVEVLSPNFPSARAQISGDSLLSISDPMIFVMSQRDDIFDYTLSGNKKTVLCAKQDMNLSCDVTKLEMSQGQKYAIKLHRFYRETKLSELYSEKFTTVTPVRVLATSIGNDEYVLSKPTGLILETNKEIKDYSGITIEQVNDSGESTTVDHTIKILGKKIAINFNGELPRQAKFMVTVKSINSTDNGHLSAPFEMSFTTSGGPKVLGVNIGTYAVSQSAPIAISFDSPISEVQNIAAHVSLAGAESNVAIHARGNTVYITPVGALPKCATLTVNIGDKVESAYGVSGGSGWSYGFRTICQSVFSIGTSVEGRPILAHSFGNGSETVVFVAGTHGNEPSSKYTLDSWVNDLEAQYGKIPTNKRIIVIPNLNPDAYLQDKRTNAHNVDLNRNFPANNWKKDVTVPGGTLVINGGGPTALSEPESKSLANYVLSVSPKLVLTYHAQAHTVIANDSGNSMQLAHEYASHSSYRALSNSSLNGLFTYDTTGAFEDWLHDKHGIPALLIEHTTSYTNEFHKNQNAMWAMID